MAVFKPTVKIKTCVLIFLLFAGQFSTPAIGSHSHFQKDITITSGIPEPGWKDQWDEARLLAVKGDFEKAAEQYSSIIEMKPRVEAIRWEYCKVLFELADYGAIKPHLESLVEASPYNSDYLSMMGHIYLALGEYDKSLALLGQVYSADPSGYSGTRTLAGLVESLKRLGREPYAFILMEQLYLRRSHDPVLLQELAETAFKLGFNQKSSDYYTLLLNRYEVSDEVIKTASEAIFAAGNEEEAVRIWQQIVNNDPNSFGYYKKISDYFLSSGQPSLAVPYLEWIIANNPEFAPELLLKTGRIYFYEMERADKAIRLFERYLESMPEHVEIRTEIEAVRKRISEEFLAIVANAGAEQLWEDLKLITSDPGDIFIRMANKFEEQEELGEAIDILEILYDNGYKSDDIALRLAGLYSLIGDMNKSSQFYAKVKNQIDRTPSFYRKKLAFEKNLGWDRKALKTATQLLSIPPHSTVLLEETLRLAGDIGFKERLIELGDTYIDDQFDPKKRTVYLTYAKSLREVGEFGKAVDIYKNLFKQPELTEQTKIDIQLEMATLAGELGRKEHQQKIYERIILDHGYNRAAVRGLFTVKLEAGDLEGAEAEYQKLLQPPAAVQLGISHAQREFENAKVHSRLLEKQGEIERAIAELNKLVAYYDEKGLPTENVDRIRLDLDTNICRLYIKEGEFSKCDDLLNRHKGKEATLITIRFLKNIIENQGVMDIPVFVRDTKGARNSSGSLTALFEGALLAEAFEMDETALALSRVLMKEEPRSLRAKLLMKRLSSQNVE